MSGFTFATASARCCPQKFTRNPTCSESSPRSCDELERRPSEVDRLHAGVGYMPVATSRSAMLSSARHAGENSLPITSEESPKAQPPGTAQAEGPRVQDKSGERYERAAFAYPPKGHTVVDPPYIHIWETMTENLSGTRDRWGDPGTTPRSPFFVHFNGAPPR